MLRLNGARTAARTAAALTAPERDFRKLWGGETVSLFGAQVATLALPLTAALTLAATPAQMGFLSAAGFAPFLLITLFAGVWVDRHRRRPLMIGANLGRAALLLTIPLGTVLGILRLEWLYLIAFLSGICQVFFELAYQSYVPTLVGRDALMAANSKLQLSASSAQIGGPGLAGVLIESLTAPLAIVTNGVSFLVSALGIALIRTPEPSPAPAARRQALWRAIGEGLRLIAREPHLRALAGEATTFNLWHTGLTTLLILYATRELGIGAGTLGLALAVGGVGALLGSLLAAPLARRFPFGRAACAAFVLACAASLLLALVGDEPRRNTVLIGAIFFIEGIGLAASQIYVLSLRQAIAPPDLLARMNAGYRFFVTGFIPLGSLLAGALGEWLGLRPALLICAAGVASALLWIGCSPIPRLHRLPETVEGGNVAGEGVAA